MRLILTNHHKVVKSKGLYLQPSKSSQDQVVVMKFEFWAHSARVRENLIMLFFGY
jgi:hypothetical protein